MPLPNEPEVMEARLAFLDAQAALDGVAETVGVTPYACGWYGTDFHDERGCFAIAAEGGPLADLVGDRVRLVYGQKSVVVYCIGTRDMSPEPWAIAVPRRPFAAIALLSVDRIDVTVDVLAG